MRPTHWLISTQGMTASKPVSAKLGYLPGTHYMKGGVPAISLNAKLQIVAFVGFLERAAARSRKPTNATICSFAFSEIAGTPPFM